jgi:hypothetical protein
MQCKYFIPDPIGFGNGIGDCQKLVDFKAKGATDEEIEGVKRQYIGTRLLWAAWCEDNARGCLRYEEKENENHL